MFSLYFGYLYFLLFSVLGLRADLGSDRSSFGSLRTFLLSLMR